MTRDAGFHRPGSLKAAWDLLEAGPQAARVAWAGPKPKPFPSQTEVSLIDLAGLDLEGIALDGDENSLVIGSMTRLSELSGSQILGRMHGGILERAVGKTAHHGLRNLATIGGAVEDARGAPEIASALLASGATVRIYDGSERKLALIDYFSQHDQGMYPGIVLALEIDTKQGETAVGDIQWVVRSPMDQALIVATITYGFDKGAMVGAHVAVAADGLRPQRLQGLEAALEGEDPNSVTLEFVRQAAEPALDPSDSFRCKADYQREMALVLIERALRAATGAEVSHEG